MNDDGNELFRSRPYYPARPPDDGPKKDGLIWYGETPPTPPAYLVDQDPS